MESPGIEGTREGLGGASQRSEDLVQVLFHDPAISVVHGWNRGLRGSCGVAQCTMRRHDARSGFASAAVSNATVPGRSS